VPPCEKITSCSCSVRIKSRFSHGATKMDKGRLSTDSRMSADHRAFAHESRIILYSVSLSCSAWDSFFRRSMFDVHCASVPVWEKYVVLVPWTTEGNLSCKLQSVHTFGKLLWGKIQIEIRTGIKIDLGLVYSKIGAEVGFCNPGLSICGG